MRLYVWLLMGLVFGACKSIPQDEEMKGMLTIDKSAYGNAFLEFNDPASKQTRFIHPGKKIVKMVRKGFTKLEITMMDSRRVQLAKIEIPTKMITSKDNSFFMPAKALNQAWDMKGRQKLIRLRTEIHPRTGAQSCTANCQGKPCKGWTGPVFEALDYRFDYEIQFLPENMNKVWGHFVATGSFLSDYNEETYRDCRPAVTIYPASQELYQ